MDALGNLLLHALIVGVIAFVAALLLRTRQGVLAYVGAGFLGEGIGLWLFGLVHVKEPLAVSSVPVLATFVGALLVFLVIRLVHRAGFRGWRGHPA